MKARNLVSPQPTVRSDDPATAAMAQLARPQVRAVLVLDAEGRLVGVLSDSMLLRQLLPPYVEQDTALARVVAENAADVLADRLRGRSVADLLPEDVDEEPIVDADATLIEVASVMVRVPAPMVGVIEDDALIGGITIEDLLSHLLASR